MSRRRRTALVAVVVELAGASLFVSAPVAVASATKPVASAVARTQAVARVRQLLVRNNANPLCTETVIRRISAAAISKGGVVRWRVTALVGLAAYTKAQPASWIVGNKGLTPADQLAAELQSCPRSSP